MTKRFTIKSIILLLCLATESFALDYANYANTTLEKWEFNDPANTPLQNATNTSGNASWNSTPIYTDGNGCLKLENSGDHWSHYAALPKILPHGIYELSWRVSSLDLSNTTAGDNCGIALFLDNLPHIRLFANGSSDLALIIVGGPKGWNRIRTFNGRTISNLVIRTVYNTVDNTTTVYSEIDGTPEQSYAITNSPSNITGDSSLVYGHFLTAQMLSNDYINIDYITLKAIDIDTDGDGIFNANDPDDDNDSFPDTNDFLPFDPSEWIDGDSNGVGDNVQFDQSVLDIFSNELGVVLSPRDHDTIARAVKPFLKEDWRIRAETRIEQHRKANLTLNITDADGIPLPNVNVQVKMIKRKFHFGLGIPSLVLVGRRTLNGLTKDEFRNMIVKFADAIGAENAFKPQFRWQYMPSLDELISWAHTNNLPVRGHLLMWPSGVRNIPHESPNDPPSYPIAEKLSTAESNATPANIQSLRDAVDFQISDWASRWDVYQWDVINESSDANIFTNLLGEHCIVDWFNNAASNSVNHNAELVLNDYFMITDNRSAYILQKIDRCKHIIQYLQANNAPLHAMGFQSHFGVYHVQPDELYARMDEFAAYGLNLIGTEFTMDQALSEDEITRRTAEIMTEYFSHPAATGLFSWSFCGTHDGNMVDSETGKVRMLGVAWYYLTRIVWTTDTNLIANTNGQATVRAFKGDYKITVLYNGQSYESELSLSSNHTANIQISASSTSHQNLYASWLNSYSNLNTQTNFTADPDGDGSCNLAEYAFGSNPDNRNSRPLILISRHAPGKLACTYPCRSDADARHLTYLIERNHNINQSANWSTNGITQNLPHINTNSFGITTNIISSDGIFPEFYRIRILYRTQ